MNNLELYRASAAGQIETLQQLIAEGVDVNLISEGCTPIEIAARYGHVLFVNTCLLAYQFKRALFHCRSCFLFLFSTFRSTALFLETLHTA